MEIGVTEADGSSREPARDRRTRVHARAVRGGQRASDPPLASTDPPLTTAECAGWLGVGSAYILGEIKAGRLKAEAFGAPGSKRLIYRVHHDDFDTFLDLINFKRKPKRL